MDNIVLDKTIKVTSGFPSSLHAQKHNLWRLVEYGFTVRDHMSFLHPINQQWQSTDWHTLTDTHTHTFNGPLSGATRVSRYHKGKPIWTLQKRQYVGVASAGLYESAPHFRQTTTSVSHHSSFLQAGCPSCYLTNSAKALKKTQNTDPKKWLGLICSSFTRIQQTVHTVLGVYLKTYLFVCY